MQRALFPEGSEASATALFMSPGIVSGDHVFLTGMTGSRRDGSVPEDLEEQFCQAFDKIAAVLKDAGLNFGSVVEMTSYHLGLRDHFDLFNKIRATYVQAPYPAWTAVEVAGLRRQGAVVEIRVIAALKDL